MLFAIPLQERWLVVLAPVAICGILSHWTEKIIW